MDYSDKIYILENLYYRLGVDMGQIISDCSKILTVNNKVSRIRYLNDDNKDSWLAFDNGAEVSSLGNISNPLSIYTRPDLKEDQSQFEKEFLIRFIDSTDIHCHFEKLEFIEKYRTFDILTKYISNILNTDYSNICWVLFKWTNPNMCDWHQDGQNTYKVSNITNPSKVTINLSLTKDSYIELKKTNNEIISTNGQQNEVFMFDHNQRMHRIILNSKYRLGLAVRARNVKFENVVQNLYNLKLIKHIIE